MSTKRSIYLSQLQSHAKKMDYYHHHSTANQCIMLLPNDTVYQASARCSSHQLSSIINITCSIAPTNHHTQPPHRRRPCQSPHTLHTGNVADIPLCSASNTHPLMYLSYPGPEPARKTFSSVLYPAATHHHSKKTKKQKSAYMIFKMYPQANNYLSPTK